MVIRRFKISRSPNLYTKKSKAGYGIYFPDGTLVSGRKFKNRADAESYYRRIRRIGRK